LNELLPMTAVFCVFSPSIPIMLDYRNRELNFYVPGLPGFGHDALPPCVCHRRQPVDPFHAAFHFKYDCVVVGAIGYEQ
jgi:hypothetical protein